MKTELRKWASRQPIKSRSSKQVLRTIAWMAGDGVMVNVSHQRIVKRSGYCRRTVIMAVQWLKSRGLIEVYAQRGARGRQAANRYILKPSVNIDSRVQNRSNSRVQNNPKFQSAKNAPLYTEVVSYHGKNEPRDTVETVVIDRGRWDGGWPPPDARLEDWIRADDDPVIDTDWTSWEPCGGAQ